MQHLPQKKSFKSNLLNELYVTSNDDYDDGKNKKKEIKKVSAKS